MKKQATELTEIQELKTAVEELTKTVQMLVDINKPKEFESFRLHDNLFIPEYGDFGKSIDISPKAPKTKDLKAHWTGTCLSWELKNKRGMIGASTVLSGIFK